MAHGTGSAVIRTTPVIYVTTAQRERLFSRLVIDSSGCLLWTGNLDKYGYGRIQVGSRINGTNRMLTAYQVMYALFVGPVPDGLELDHLCRVRRCAAPDHLEPVTHRANLLRGNTLNARHSAATHCPQNHEYDLLNTYFTAEGWRSCRACWTDSNRRRAAAKAAQRRALSRQG
jgi:HNH endonuclease